MGYVCACAMPALFHSPGSENLDGAEAPWGCLPHALPPPHSLHGCFCCRTLPVAAAGETRVTPDGGSKLTQPASLSQEFGKRTGGTFWWLAGGRGHWGSVWPVHSTEVNLERTELEAGMCPPHPLNKYLWGAYYVPGVGDSRGKRQSRCPYEAHILPR